MSMFQRKFKEYKKKKELSSKKASTAQFIEIFNSVSRELNLYEREDFQRIINIMGTSRTSSDVFIKMVLIVHSVGGVGLSILRRLPSEKVESLKQFEMKSITDLLKQAFPSVSEMVEGVDEKVLEEPFNLYVTAGSYLSGLQRLRVNNLDYHQRMGKDYDMEERIQPSINRIQSEGKEGKSIDLLEKYR